MARLNSGGTRPQSNSRFAEGVGIAKPMEPIHSRGQRSSIRRTNQTVDYERERGDSAGLPVHERKPAPPRGGAASEEEYLPLYPDQLGDGASVEGEQLPPDWEALEDEEGNIYYHHSISGQTQWNPPEKEYSASQPAQANLPPDWEIVQEDDGSIYYHHIPTGHTQWDPPCGSWSGAETMPEDQPFESPTPASPARPSEKVDEQQELLCAEADVPIAEDVSAGKGMGEQGDNSSRPKPSSKYDLTSSC